MRRRCTLWYVFPVVGMLTSPVLASGDFSLSLAGLQGSLPASGHEAAGSSLETLPTSLSPGLGTASAVAPLSLGAENGASRYLSLKLGPQWYLGDFDDLDVGLYSEIALGVELLPILALEVASGYFWGEDDSSSADVDLWGVPILAQAKVTLPIWILHVYGGLGVGVYYVDTDVDVGPISDDESDWVFGGNAFLGAAVSISRLFAGLELKYTITEDVDVAFGGSENLEGISLLAVLGFRF